jgi:uncharacterized protein YabE (DUF348 family)
LIAGGLLLALGIGITLFAVGVQRTVMLEINGVLVEHRTRQHSAHAILQEIGVAPQLGDRYEIPSASALRQGEPLRIAVMRRIALIQNEQVRHLQTHARTVGAALAEAGVALRPEDRPAIAYQPCAEESALPLPAMAEPGQAARLVAALRAPIPLSLRAATPVTLLADGQNLPLLTIAHTVAEALHEAGVLLYAGDEVMPPLHSEVVPDLTIQVRRATPVTLEVGGQPWLVRTLSRTVQALLDEEGVTLRGEDYVRPEPTAPLRARLAVQVVRVLTEQFVQELPVGFAVRWEPNPNMEIDERETTQWGREGALRRRLQVRYENEQETHRETVAEWLAREPMDRIIHYGTKIVLRQVDTPSGPVTYWRKLRMLATSYNAATAGKAASHPQYGITRSGQRARMGIVAVDPKVVSLGQDVYVPGYGTALAADTGGAIKGRRIDLCYDDHNLVLWYRWVDVYLLAPVPDAKDILWIVANDPGERD